MRRSLSIGANVKFSGVKQALQPVMDQIAGLPALLEKIVQDYARPGDLAKELLGKRLRAADDRIQALAQVITGEDSAKSFVDQLVAEALDIVDGKVDGWTALANGEVTSLTPSILDGLSIPQTARADLEALLNEKLLETSDALGQEVKTQLASALQNNAGPEIVDFLNALSLQATTTLNALNTSATELLKPVNAFLAQYRKFEQSLADAVEVVEKEELALQFIRTVDKSKERTALLTFALDPSDDRAAALYRQMLVGNFREAMTAGLDAALAYITLVDGQFKTVFERKATTGIKINFFDMPLTFQRILTSNLTVENSVGGEISIFDIAGSAQAMSLAFGEKEETTISSSLSLVGAKNEPDAQGLSIRLRYSDENLTTQEMRDYLTSFTAVGLLADGAADRVSDGTTTIGIPDDDGNRALKINAQMSLTRSDIEKIAGIPEETVMTTAIREQLDALDETPVNRQYLVGILPSDAQLDPKNHELFTSSTLRISDELKRRGARGLPLQLNYSAHLIHNIGLNAEGLIMFLKCWQELVAMPLPELGADRQLKASDLSRFDDKNTEMIASLANWAQVAGFIRTSLGEEYISPWSLAFLKTLRALSDRKKDWLPIYVSWNQDGRVRRIAVI